jgi:deoxyhypusine synthase
VSAFTERHYRHFNASALKDAADGYRTYLDSGGVMLMTIGGAMSTADLGVSLAEMIRVGKANAICSNGANLEEDVFNLVAHDHYERIPGYRELSAADEQALLARHLNRVTDTCIPEHEAMSCASSSSRCPRSCVANTNTLRRPTSQSCGLPATPHASPLSTTPCGIMCRAISFLTPAYATKRIVLRPADS